MINTKKDWIKAGFEILINEGINNVKIEAMARKLGVTKGGFYGYFLNREAFLQAMLEDWEERHSSEIFNYINSLTGSLSDKLQKLLYAVDDIKYDAIELSMCNWATNDPLAKKILMRVVRERLEFCTNLFLEGGFAQDEAEKRANIVHHFMAGCRSFRPLLPTNGSPERHEQLDHFLKQVTASVD
jgi:AcrR family transcriptional regulator